MALNGEVGSCELRPTAQGLGEGGQGIAAGVMGKPARFGENK